MQTVVLATRAKSFAMKSIGEQVAEYMQTHALKPGELAARVRAQGATNVQRQHIEGLVKAGYSSPKYLVQLAAAMCTTAEVLTKGTFNAETSTKEPNFEFAGMARESRRVPVVGTAKMGPDGFYGEISSIPGAGDGFIEIATTDKHAYSLRVRGDSMMPAIRDGWYVLIEPNGIAREGEFILLKLVNGQRMVKEMLSQRIDAIVIMSVNGDERRTLYREEIESIQPVSAVVSPSKWRPE